MCRFNKVTRGSVTYLRMKQFFFGICCSAAIASVVKKQFLNNLFYSQIIINVTVAGKSSREYRTPPAVAPPQVPSHYAPNYPRRPPGYSTLPVTQPQVNSSLLYNLLLLEYTKY